MSNQNKLPLIKIFSNNNLIIKISWLIISFGIMVRLIQYIYNRSLWADEAVLALNIINRSYLELTQPLDYDQVAPIGFLWIEKFLVDFFGNNEYTLRFFPLITGLLSLFIFAMIARRYLDNLGRLIAILLFTTIPAIIYYATEVKQYSSDIFITLLLCYLLAPYGKKKSTSSKIIIKSVLVAISLWISHPAIFILVAMILVNLVDMRLKEDPSQLGQKIIIYLSGLLSFALLYFGFLNKVNNNQNLLNSWGEAFPNHPLNIIWYLDAFCKFFYKPLGLESGLDVIGIILFLLGCYSYFQKNKIILVTLLFPLLTTFTGAGLQLYPFRSRVVLFLAPFFIIAIAEGVNWLSQQKIQPAIALLLTFVITITVVYPGSESSIIVFQPREKEEIKQVIDYIQAREQPQDVLYIYQRGIYQFLYYAEKYGYQPGDYILGVEDLDLYDGSKLSDTELQRYKKDFDSLRGNSRVWLLFSHVTRNSEYLPIKKYLDTIGTKLDTFEAKGAFVHLYNLE